MHHKNCEVDGKIPNSLKAIFNIETIFFLKFSHTAPNMNLGCLFFCNYCKLILYIIPLSNNTHKSQTSTIHSAMCKPTEFTLPHSTDERPAIIAAPINKYCHEMPCTFIFINVPTLLANLLAPTFDLLEIYCRIMI